MTGTPQSRTVVGLTVRAAAECKTLLALPEIRGQKLSRLREQAAFGMQYGMVFDKSATATWLRTAWRGGPGGSNQRAYLRGPWWISATR